LVGTGVRRSFRRARAAGVAVQLVLLAGALQSHRPVFVGAVAAVTVVTTAALLSPALAPVCPPDGATVRHQAGRPRDSERAPGD